MATMQDVAKRAGVSIASVSFVVNDSKHVTPATRARIEAAMSELGFRRNIVARALASKRTRVIALLFPALDQQIGALGLEMVTTAARTANNLDYHLVLWPVSNDAADLDDYVAGGLVDGVILMEVQTHDARVARLQALGIPFVLMGRVEDSASFTYVDIDFERMVNDAVTHLTGLGHRQIGLIVESSDEDALPGYGPVTRTVETFQQRMLELGEQPVLVKSSGEPVPGERAMRELLTEHPDITAVMVLNELAAFGVIKAAHERGYSVPDDISIVMLSTNRRTGVMSTPTLTCLVSPSIELGQRSVAALIDVLDGDHATPEQTLLTCELQTGESTGPVRATTRTDR